MSLASPYDRRGTSRAADAIPLAPLAPLAPAAAPAAGLAACGNCGTARVGEYCSSCGQHFLDDRLTFRVLAREGRERVLERGLFQTLRDMATQPGRVVRNYVEGRRRRYMNPLSFLFLGGALSLLLFPLTRDLLEAYLRSSIRASLSEGRHPLLTLEQTEEYVRLTMLVSQNTTYVALCVCVIFALFLRLFFRKQGINLVESSVFALFTFGFVYFLSAPLALLLAAGVGSVGMYVYSTFPLYVAVCGLTAAQYFDRRVWSAMKAGVAVLLSYAVFSIAMSVGIFAYILWPGR